MRVSATALKSWVQGDPMETEAILSDEIAQRSNPTHDALAVCALIRTHLGEWETALDTTEMVTSYSLLQYSHVHPHVKSLRIKSSPIGQIARSIALVSAGKQDVALDEMDFVFCDCDPSDIKLLLVIKSMLLFVCNKRKQAISRIHRFIDDCDERMNDIYLQVLGMMYLKQGDYGNAAQTLGIVKNPFTAEDRGPLASLFIIFNWNFKNLKSIAWQRACERLYATGSMKEVGDTLLKMVTPLPENKKERAHGDILQEIINRSGEVTLLAWTGKSSTCNSCLPSSPAVYAQTQLTLLPLEEDELDKRIAKLRAIVALPDALMAYGSVTCSQPARFAHFRLLLPCINFRVKTLKKEQENVYHAETVGLGDVEFTTADSLPLKQPRKLIFVNPWIHHLRKWHGDRDEDKESDVELDTHVGSIPDADINVGLVHEPMIEEDPTPPSRTLDVDIHTRALELIARLGQPFSALLLLKQPDGAYKRVAADNEIVVRGIEDDALKDIRVEFLEVL
ncbi:hypothetical protein JVU11DRAFT_10329 [Chiua virens]|nr:hypothetical protein JVU11DRAFT_10329 [Chiua virens]